MVVPERNVVPLDRRDLSRGGRRVVSRSIVAEHQSLTGNYAPPALRLRRDTGQRTELRSVIDHGPPPYDDVSPRNLDDGAVGVIEQHCPRASLGPGVETPVNSGIGSILLLRVLVVKSVR
jgi:hypothetical protein